MEPKEIHLNINKLHQDVEKIRRIRNSINGDIEIRLIWGESDEHMIRVVANGPNLWVKGYYGRDGAFNAFDAKGGAHVLNYAEDDIGCNLALSAIIPTVKVLKESQPKDFSQGGTSPARKAYIMCVFLVSEMVRNELLERALLQETRKPGQRRENGKIGRNWDDYILTYKNWKKVSRQLYQTGDGDNYPTIYAADVRSMYSRLRTGAAKGIMTERELAVYDELLQDLKIL